MHPAAPGYFSAFPGIGRVLLPQSLMRSELWFYFKNSSFRGAEPGANSPRPACARLPGQASPFRAPALTCGSHACSFLPSSASSPRQSNPHLCATSAAAAARASEGTRRKPWRLPGCTAPARPAARSLPGHPPPPSARGAGVTRAKAAGLRAPGEEPACSVPELGIARQRRGEGEGGMRRGRARGGLGRAGLHAPRRIPASASSGGKGRARAEEDATANGKLARLHLSGTSRQAAARAGGGEGEYTHVRVHIHRHTHAHTRPDLNPDPSRMASGALCAPP